MRYECEAFAETAEGYETRIRFGASSLYFRGHFEGAPVLPGVALLSTARELLARRVRGMPELVGLAALRFRRPVQPGDRVVLTFVRKAPAELAMTAHVAETLVADGRLRYASEVPLG